MMVWAPSYIVNSKKAWFKIANDYLCMKKTDMSVGGGKGYLNKSCQQWKDKQVETVTLMDSLKIAQRASVKRTRMNDFCDYTWSVLTMEPCTLYL